MLTTLVHYLLGQQCGNRLKTIDELATEAVVLTRVEDYPVQQLLRSSVDQQALLAHQQGVVKGTQETSN